MYSFVQAIEQIGWKKFCSQPIEGIFPVMQEFYANLSNQKDYNVYVQGKTVPFDSEIINNLHGMPDIPFNECTDYLE